MMFGDDANQLELFDVETPFPARPARRALGRVLWQFRYDHLVLGGIAGLIGVAVVFALGVERGKRLARSEGSPWRARSQQAASPEASRAPIQSALRADGKPSIPPAASSASPAPGKADVPRQAAPQPVQAQPKPSTLNGRTPVRPASTKSRYAVQVVAYSRVQLARQEVQRLKARGEPAFLVMRNGRTMVYVGPFASRTNANDRVLRLKSRYTDCFVKIMST